jgi:hypothetical protein
MAKSTRQAAAPWRAAPCDLLHAGEGFMSRCPNGFVRERFVIEKEALGYPIKIADNPLAAKAES